MGKYISIALLYFFGTIQVKAHNPNDISYFFKLDEKQLVIHLTPKSAIDLLEHMHPQLRNENRFLLHSYSLDFQSYFERHVLLTIDRIQISMALIETQLDKHDARLVFELVNVPNTPKDFELTVSSFLGRYKKVKNYVFVHSNGVKHHYQLDNNRTQVLDSFQITDNQYTISKIPFFSGGLALLFLSIGWVVYRIRKGVVKPSPIT
ncbi:hypothetical protein L0P88_00480 [Muricauda sp. SCSIO 64092]|uniref:DUF6702 family protein n=1 Tax=Allomuricauda sp. SCSIO 64092 TaxID=2908842 RepID=UPI001FF35A3E|nr:DUF6702 family protein [Muricauda sp. SCSIO 64092]UOY07042.1 hypothetical protein L0P88_00480 [Muricauda sp. SCSIO 64092]